MANILLLLCLGVLGSAVGLALSLLRQSFVLLQLHDRGLQLGGLCRGTEGQGRRCTLNPGVRGLATQLKL